MLEDMEGEMHVFKAKDEGYLKLLRGNAVPKTLTVKICAPVILLKNIGNGLFNGMRGKVHSISKENLPIIDFHGRMITVSPVRFDVFDAQQQKSLASRRQIPLMLAFALTVHRAQGQTIEKLEIDCYSFFAPGQMGVAVGRARDKTGLCIRNFNKKAANLKHPQCVYDFYDNVEQF
ncbi:ATP-dependent DNA helicase PIF1 [Mizuhopecten yessoensis]|uniref:ATP-dependent DNA helicase PIF1 n=1 Tax=Mizuhopecten yessoensis TaxID=6573 RepID=A0A210Q2S0_MIZYE|nr:ATP-dependent DNA helicase PIF1 [Mizuhopecten yessoensis]